MRIGVNALYLIPGAVGGTEIYLRSLLTALAEIDHQNTWFVFTNRETGPDLVPPQPNFVHVPQVVPGVNLPARLLWEQTALPLAVMRRKLDVLFNPGFTAPLLCPCPQVTVFHDLMARRLVSVLPGLAARVAVVPQSVFFESGSDAAAPAADTGHDPSLLFPAGIRAVKNPRVPLAPLDRVAPRYPGLTLSYVGPILEAGEGAALAAALRDRPWARHLGPRPHQSMRALFERADVVLNCSASEGGMANYVLEAFALGRAVLASNIEGNRSLVEDGVTGLLFDTPEEFGVKAEQLLGDRDLRRRLGVAGREVVSARFGRARERDGYLAVYARVMAAARRA